MGVDGEQTAQGGEDLVETGYRLVLQSVCGEHWIEAEYHEYHDHSTGYLFRSGFSAREREEVSCL